MVVHVWGKSLLYMGRGACVFQFLQPLGQIRKRQPSCIFRFHNWNQWKFICTEIQYRIPLGNAVVIGLRNIICNRKIFRKTRNRLDPLCCGNMNNGKRMTKEESLWNLGLVKNFEETFLQTRPKYRNWRSRSG